MSGKCLLLEMVQYLPSRGNIDSFNISGKCRDAAPTAPPETKRERGRRGRKPLPMPAFHNPACPFNAELGACEPFPRSLVHRAPTWQRGEIPSSPRRVDPYLITYEPLFTVSPWHLRKNRCSPTSTCD